MPVELVPLPDEAAIRALAKRGATLLESWDWRDVGAEVHKGAFTVAKSAGFDILSDIATSLTESLKKGDPGQSWRQQIRPILEQKGWWGRKELPDPQTGEIRSVQLGSNRRLSIIFDANMRVSHAQGRWERTERLADRLPYLRYVAVLDERTRQLHRQWHGTILRWDDPWWDTHYPPNGWRCRCTVMQLGVADLKRYGWTAASAAPRGVDRMWTNHRTGETQFVPFGIDPGWGHNPGKMPGFAIDPAKYAHMGLGYEAAEACVRSPEFAALVGDQRKGAIPVGYVEADLAEALGTNVRRVDLSAETMAKQRRNHPDLSLAEYRLLPRIIQSGTIIRQGALKVAIYHDPAGRWYRAVIKATGKGEALYLVSLHRLHGDGSQDIARELARGGQVIRGIGER